MTPSEKFPLLKTQNWPINLDLLPPTIYVVGGAVRDALLNRKRSYFDLDLVLPYDAIKIAKKIAKHYHAGFVILDEIRQIARVVFPKATVDFAQFEGETIEKDLARRDFTINAIAYNPNTDELIDPFYGINDLNIGQLKMISPTNLADDSLRLLRAYRQASQLNFVIETNTRSTIRKLASLLNKIAAERVKTELDYLLKDRQGSIWLISAFEDGLLSIWLPNLTKEKVNGLLHIDEAVKWIEENFPPIANSSTSWYALAKLAHLVSSIPEKAELELVNLKYSRAEIRIVITAIKYLPQLKKVNNLKTLRQQYFFFLNVGEVFPIIAVLALALGIQKQQITPLIHRYLDPQDLVAHPKPLINGNDLIQSLDISPSPKIGEILTEIQIAFIEGKISTKDEAISFAKSLL